MASMAPAPTITPPLMRTSVSESSGRPMRRAMAGATRCALAALVSGFCMASTPPMMNMLASMGRAALLVMLMGPSLPSCRRSHCWNGHHHRRGPEAQRHGGTTPFDLPRRGQDGDGYYTVEPEVIAGRDDDVTGEDGMEQRQPPPRTGADEYDGQPDDDGPADMHRRHGRQLVGRPASEGGVHRLVVHEPGIDEPGAGKQPGRRHRQQLHEQAAQGEHGDGVPHAGVGITVAHEQPHQEDAERW